MQIYFIFDITYMTDEVDRAKNSHFVKATVILQYC